MKSLNIKKPQLISLNECCLPDPLKSLSNLVDFFGSDALMITDAEANIVKKTNFDEIKSTWFDRNPSIKAYQVVHTPRKLTLSGTQSVEWFLSSKMGEPFEDMTCRLEFHNQTKFLWEWIVFGPCSIVVPRHVDMLATDSWNYLMVGKKEWAFWDETNQMHTVEQNPGELIWIPSGCAHSVKYIEPSIAWTRNIIRRQNISVVLDNVDNKDSPIGLVLRAMEQVYVS